MYKVCMELEIREDKERVHEDDCVQFDNFSAGFYKNGVRMACRILKTLRTSWKLDGESCKLEVRHFKELLKLLLACCWMIQSSLSALEA